MEEKMNQPFKVRRKQKRKVTFILVMALIMQVFMSIPGVFAGELGKLPTTIMVGGMEVEFTEISIKEVDGLQKEVGGSAENPIKAEINYNIYYYMELRDCSKMTTSAAVQLKISEEFILGKTTIPIILDDGEQIGECEIEANGEANLRFFEKLAEYEELNGVYFHVGSKFNEDKVEDVGEKAVEFKIQNKIIAIPLFFEPAPKKPAVISKSGEFDSDNNIIKWKIIVKETGDQTLLGATIIDEINLEELSLVKLKDVNNLEIDKNKYTYDENSGRLEYPLPDDAKVPYTFFIETTLKDKMFEEEGDKLIKNKVSLFNATQDKLLAEEKEASIKVNVDWIDKKGVLKVENGYYIDWTISINQNERPIAGMMLKDTIPEGLELVEGSVKLQQEGESSLDDLEATSDKNALDGSNYYKEGVDGSTLLHYKIGSNAPEVKYFLTYKTKVVKSDIHDTNTETKFNNRVDLGRDGSYKYHDAYEVGIPTSMLAKDGKYSRKNHIITWNLTVNANKIDLEEAQVIDYIPEGLKLKKETIKVINKDSAGEISLSEIPHYDEATRALTIKLGDMQGKTYSVSFETEIENAKVYATNLKEPIPYVNRAQLSGKKNGIDLPVSKISKSVDVTSEVINKQGLGYNYATREITWEIIVNQNQMPIANAIVKDMILEGQSYIEDTFALSVYKNGAYEGLDYKTSGALVTPDKSNNYLLSYTFNEEIENQYSIRFKTKLDEEYANTLFTETGTGKKYVENKAEIIGSPIPSDEKVEVVGKQEVRNTTISKEGKQDVTNGPILWEVIINPNQIELIDATIIDQLSEGLELDTSSVALYKMKVDEKGVLEEEQKIEDLTESISYDYANNKFTFRLPSPTQSCYKLTFETEVLKVANATYTNQVYFEGTGIKDGEKSNKKEVRVMMSGSGGSGSKRPGSIQIEKIDKKDHGPLAGAEFELFDSAGIGGRTVITNEEGKAEFTRLKLGTYTLKEINAPVGYEKVDTIFSINLMETQKSVYIKVENTASGRMIQFRKVSDTGQPLKDAKFTLYTQSDTTKVIAEAVSNEQGYVIFKDIPYGQYQLQEIMPPTGYIAAPLYTVNVNKDGTYKIYKTADFTQAEVREIPNTLIKGSIKLKKVNELEQPLQGATFGLFEAPYDAEKEPVQTDTSKENGDVYFTDVPYGNYIIREMRAPNFYRLNEESVEVSVTSVEEVSLGNYKNQLRSDYNIQVEKVDEHNNPLEHAEFTLYDLKGNVVKKATSGLDGMAFFEGVTYGHYILKETKAPKYYRLNNEEMTVKVQQDNPVKIKIVNRRLEDGQICVKKVNTEQTPLSGAEFTLFDLKGNKVESASSNSEGIATFNNVTYGKYILEETKAPIGYKQSTIKEEIEIDSNVLRTIVIVNKKEVENGSGGGGGGIPTTPEIPLISESPKAPETPLISEKPTTIETSITPGDNIVPKEEKNIDEILKPGTVVRVFDKGGQFIGEVVIGEGGKLITDIVENGQYIIKIVQEDGQEVSMEVDVKDGKVRKTVNQKTILPQAGGVIDTRMLLLLGNVLVLIGIGCTSTRRKND